MRSIIIAFLIVFISSCGTIQKKAKEFKKEYFELEEEEKKPKKEETLKIPKEEITKTFIKDRSAKLPDVKKLELSSELKEIKTLKGHTDAVNDLVFSKTGKYLISTSADKTVKIWDLKRMKLVKTLEGHADTVTSVDISKDGKYIATGSWDGSINIWDFKTGELLTTIEGIFSYINDVAFSPTDRLLAAAGIDKKIFIFDYELAELVNEIKGHTDAINSLAFSPNGKYLVSASSDRTVKVWSVHKGELLKTLAAHNDIAKSVAYSRNGKYVASGGWDNTINVWDTKKWLIYKKFQSPALFVNSVDFSKDSRFLATAHWDNSIHIWNIQTGEDIKSKQAFRSYVTVVKFSPTQRIIAAGSNDSDIKIFSLGDGYFSAIIVAPAQIVTYSGTKVKLPVGTYVEVDVLFNEIFVPDKNIKGKLIKGKYDTLYKVLNPVVVFEETSIYKSPKFVKKIGNISAGTILDTKSILLSPDLKAALIKVGKKHGWIKSGNIAKLEKNTDFYIVTAKEAVLLDSPKGKKLAKLIRGMALEGIYYAPYLKTYYVKTPVGKGWVKEEYITKVDYETVRQTYIVLKGAKILISPFMIESSGKLPEGIEIKPEARVKIDNKYYYYVDLTKYGKELCKGYCMGYIEQKYLKPVNIVSKHTVWTKEKTALRLSPKGTKIIDIEKSTELNPLAHTENYYKVEINPPGITGWVEKKSLTSIKPKKVAKTPIIEEEIPPKPKPKPKPKKKPVTKKVKKKERIAYINVPALNLREKPVPGAKILAVIPRGYEVIVLEKGKNGWVKVKYYSRTKNKFLIGWLKEKYLKYKN
ncbi:MAG: SH3 domain-containing protein [Aquificae bacterium]|nr:SH3 domain-containing protein [Aquificota bacterium]